jgi:hypothetical protein
MSTFYPKEFSLTKIKFQMPISNNLVLSKKIQNPAKMKDAHASPHGCEMIDAHGHQNLDCTA